MTAATDTLEHQLLKLLFNNTAMTGLGDAAGLPGSTEPGALYISLHAADPGEEGAQNTHETDYGNYARVAVPRTASGWTIIDNAFKNTGTVQFPACTAGESTLTHVGIGTAASGAGKLLWRAAFTTPPSLNVTQGIAPKFDPDVIAGEVN